MLTSFAHVIKKEAVVNKSVAQGAPLKFLDSLILVSAGWINLQASRMCQFEQPGLGASEYWTHSLLKGIPYIVGMKRLVGFARFAALMRFT